MITVKNQILQQKSRENKLFILLLILLSFTSLFFFFPEYKLYPGLDSYFHCNRIIILMESIKDGTFPVYLDSDGANGFGYGTPLFYSDLLLIPFALLALLTNIVIAQKIIILFLSFFCAYFTSIAASRISGSRFVGYLTAILFSFSYYRIWGMSHRFALGEAFSFVFIPLIAWGMYEIISGQYKHWYILALGFALLMSSHLLTTTLTGIILVPIVLINLKKILKEKKRVLALIKAAIITLFLSAYSLLPLLEQYSSNKFNLEFMAKFINPALTKLDYINFAKGFIAGFYFEGIDADVFLGAQGVGLILSILILLRVFLIRKKNSLLRMGDFCFIYGLILLIATCKIFPWGRFPFNLLNVIQFPWRLAEYSTAFWAFASAIYLSLLADTYTKKLKAISIVLVATLVMMGITSYSFRNFKSFQNLDLTPSEKNSFHLGGYEYVPLKYVFGTEYFMNQIANRKEGVVTDKEQTTISDYSHLKSNIRFHINTQNSLDSIIVPLFYYKGYQATFNEKNIPVTQSKNGLLQLVVKGQGIVDVDFKGTLIQKYSLYITFMSIILLLVYIFISNRKIKKS